MSGARVDGGRRRRSQHCGSRADLKVNGMSRRMQTDARGLCWALRFDRRRSFAAEKLGGKDLRMLRWMRDRMKKTRYVRKRKTTATATSVWVVEDDDQMPDGGTIEAGLPQG
jgi:hypothetical protein